MTAIYVSLRYTIDRQLQTIDNDRQLLRLLASASVGAVEECRMLLFYRGADRLFDWTMYVWTMSLCDRVSSPDSCDKPTVTQSTIQLTFPFVCCKCCVILTAEKFRYAVALSIRHLSSLHKPFLIDVSLFIC